MSFGSGCCYVPLLVFVGIFWAPLIHMVTKDSSFWVPHWDASLYLESIGVHYGDIYCHIHMVLGHRLGIHFSLEWRVVLWTVKPLSDPPEDGFPFFTCHVTPLSNRCVSNRNHSHIAQGCWFNLSFTSWVDLGLEFNMFPTKPSKLSSLLVNQKATLHTDCITQSHPRSL